MTILYFYQYFGTPKGGWSTRVYEMGRRWVAAGHEVKVITSLYDKSDLHSKGVYSRQLIDGIEVYVINILLSNKHRIFRRICSFLFFALVATWLGIKLKADVFIASSGPITVGIPALFAKWLRRKPLVFEVRDLWPEGAVAFGIIRNPWIIKTAYWFEKLCYQNSALIIACSPGIQHSIILRFPATQVITIPNASDVGLFRHADIPQNATIAYQDKHLFVYTGTLGLIDDCRQILEAAAILQQRQRNDIQILMIGDGKERLELEAKAKADRLVNVSFLGLMPKTKLIAYIRQARASILTVKPIPFMDHCSPNKMFDAFAAGIPIIQTTRGWIHELIEKEQCGINVAPNDPINFADAIERLADDALLYKKMSEQSAKLGDQVFNRDLLAQQMLEAIEQVYEGNFAHPSHRR